MRRVGWHVNAGHPAEVFDERGREQWRLIRSLLVHDGGLDGASILDFGCGVGRVLRHAVTENPEADHWGCDLDARSVEWLQGNASPRLHVFQSAEWPPLPRPAGQFDVIYAFSVFTHLVDSWSAWLLEMHRLLKDDGILIATVFGPGHDAFAGERVAEEVIGMNVLTPSANWDDGGPLILHSQWWLRAHWGRAFEILELRAGDPAGHGPLFGQGLVMMRKRPGTFTVEQLERAEPGEARELAAARQNVASLRREIAVQSRYLTSRSWRLTAPLRALGRRARRGR